MVSVRLAEKSCCHSHDNGHAAGSMTMSARGRDLARILKMPVQMRYFPKKCLSRGQAASAAQEPPCGGGSGGRSRPPEAKGSTCSEVHSKGYPASKIGNLGRSFDVFHSTSNDKTFEFFIF